MHNNAALGVWILYAAEDKTMLVAIAIYSFLAMQTIAVFVLYLGRILRIGTGLSLFPVVVRVGPSPENLLKSIVL